MFFSKAATCRRSVRMRPGYVCGMGRGARRGRAQTKGEAVVGNLSAELLYAGLKALTGDRLAAAACARARASERERESWMYP